MWPFPPFPKANFSTVALLPCDYLLLFLLGIVTILVVSRGSHNIRYLLYLYLGEYNTQEAWRIKVLKMSFQDFWFWFLFLWTKTNLKIQIRKKFIDSLLRYQEISSKNPLSKTKIKFLFLPIKMDVGTSLKMKFLEYFVQWIKS